MVSINAKAHRDARESALKRYRGEQLTQLQILRLARNRTLKQVALACGCGESVVSLWERHAREPGPRFRERYANALEIDVGELGRIIYRARVKAGHE